VVSFTSQPLCPQGKSPWYPLDKRLGGSQSRFGRGGEEENSQPRPRIEPQNPDRAAHSPALYRLRILSENQEIKIYKTLIVALYGRKTLSFTPREHNLKVSGKRVLRIIFRPKTRDVREEEIELHNREFCNLYSPRNMIKWTK
jgi:hypothetical protein